ncbi:zinc finger protein 62-like isoform X1 [Bombyx mandarina]|uniref:Zinc finger protein 62-like isoform X1 n=1 Tax=Bombyx mandarina TaxID=7092 RepID=A0A6J2JPD1_BOMMA|nr:zinc finger protein 62-like isoform X1 [Bombyx mandarina]XP_028030872.1 zinc finger protein 62-like isoform X1 [Bombyx mandarina]
MNYKDKCRTCLGSSTDMRSISSSISIGGRDVQFAEILLNFYSYQVTEDPLLSENLCISCAHQLTITYSFKVLIESSYRKLIENYNDLNHTNDNYEAVSESHDENKKKYNRKKKKFKTKVKVKEELVTIYCAVCKQEFNCVKTLNEHCNNSHPTKGAGRSCDYCSEKFEDFRSLVLHRKLHLTPFLCENCWDGFLNEEELSMHTCQPNRDKSKTKTERVLRQCDQCGRSYPPNYIRIHMLTHGDERSYSCKYCPKKFKVPGSLNSHVLWNHKRTRNYKCEVCNATFISSSSKSSHIRKNHLKEKKYRCDTCGKRFFSKSELQRHSLTHTGVKNFHCHLCDKSYQTRYGLNVHLKSHTQVNMSIMTL